MTRPNLDCLCFTLKTKGVSEFWILGDRITVKDEVKVFVAGESYPTWLGKIKDGDGNKFRAEVDFVGSKARRKKLSSGADLEDVSVTVTNKAKEESKEVKQDDAIIDGP